MLTQRLVIVLAILAFMFTLCANLYAESNKGVVFQKSETQTKEATGISQAYTLGPDDVLDIQVMRHPEVSGKFPVGPDGTIQYVFIGDISVAGLTKEEARDLLKEKLTAFIKEPELTVSISAYRSKSIYVIGAVARPGEYAMKGNILTVRQAVLDAGLPTTVASMRKTRIITPNLTGGKSKVKKVNLLALLYEGDLKQNVQLNPGDIVYVPFTGFGKLGIVLDQIINPIYKAAVIQSIGNNND